MTSETAYYRLTTFDGLELLAAERYHQPFPWHAHDTFNVSLITSGTESIQFHDTTIYAPAGQLSITHPLEVHANPVLHASGLSFYTFYVSPAVMAHAANNRAVYFRERVIYNPALFAQFWHLAQRVSQPEPTFNHLFSAALRALVSEHSTRNPIPPEPASSATISTLKASLTEQLHTPVPLEQLARQHGMDKFKFLRYFKQHTGLTPHNFMLMKRVDAAKQLLQDGSSLVETALAVGFYDQAHFSRFFKSFVGVSPGQYQSITQPRLVL